MKTRLLDNRLAVTMLAVIGLVVLGVANERTQP